MNKEKVNSRGLLLGTKSNLLSFIIKVKSRYRALKSLVFFTVINGLKSYLFQYVLKDLRT